MRDKHLIIVDYDPTWPAMFAAERDRLLAVVGDYVETVEHIGSTAVPGLVAKPVIDIIIGVRNLAIADAHCIKPIKALCYEYVRYVEELMPTRRYFRKSDDTGMRTHQIHLWPLDDPEYERHIVFRDYLRAHPHEADTYAEVKRDLARKFDDVNDYADAKSALIKPCEQRAYVWWNARKDQQV
jgi:GrpB-like predicted nucleotidyltransferase (UPF0157 family)